MRAKSPIEDLEKYKRQLKKKDWIAYIFIAIGFFLIGVYMDNFVSNSVLITESNPFVNLFGITRLNVSINKNPVIRDDGYFIPIKIENSGDKDIDNIHIYYIIGGDTLRKVDLGSTRLNKNDKEEFFIPVLNSKMNLSCSETAKFVLDYYVDEKRKCYFQPRNYSIPVCMYMQISVLVYAHKNLIANHTEWYPYFEDRLLGYNVTSNSCIQITNDSEKLKLSYSPLTVITVDPSTLCRRGKDPKWCLNYKYNITI